MGRGTLLALAVAFMALPFPVAAGGGKVLIADVNAELGTPSVREKIGLEGGVPIGGTPEHFAAVIKADTGKWAEVVRMSGAKVD